MLAAELHGKISETFPPNQRMEDVLTSDVLSAFRYFTNVGLLIDFLSHAKNIGKGKLPVKGKDKAEICFWPQFSFENGVSSREADAALLFGKGSTEEYFIVVEAKYRSGLSNLAYSEGVAEQDADNLEDKEIVQLGNQLADEFCGAKCGIWRLSSAKEKRAFAHQENILLYITADYEMPERDIREALEIIKGARKCPNAEITCAHQAEKDIYWVSWRDLYAILERQGNLGFPNSTRGEMNYFMDLNKLLRKRGLKTFTPFQSIEPVGQYLRIIKDSEFIRKLTPVREYSRYFKK